MSKSIDWLRWALVLALAVGIALRTVQFREIPPGLYRDQAFNMQDAQDTLRGNVRLFYPTNFGREPLFIWLTALSVWLWGVSPLAARFPSWVVGVLTLFTCYGMTKELFGRRVGVLATAVLSVTLWHVHFSRLGFRAVLIPLLASLGVWLVVRGIRSGKGLFVALGGAATGALIYTYISARTAILPATLFVLYVWLRQRSFGTPTLRQWLLFSLPAAAVMAPFILYTLGHWEEVILRTQVAVSVFNDPQPLVMLLNNILGALGMFVFRGDFLSRHNVPFRPVFDPALGVMFLIGLGLAIAHFKRDYAVAFLLLWTGAMLLPSILTEDCPHFVRAIGVLPFATLFPALGLDWAWSKLARKNRLAAFSAVGGVLLVGLSSTVWDYFVRYPASPDLCYRFECAGIEMASEVNRFLGKGWTEGNWMVREKPGRTDRQVLVQSQLWTDVVNARVLIPKSPALIVLGRSSATPRPDISTLYYGWYNPDYPDFGLSDLNQLPRDSLIQVTAGPLAITHQYPSPHPAYLKFVATPTKLPNVVLAKLDQEISLVSSCLRKKDGHIVVQLIWHNREPTRIDYTVFVHYERDGQIIAQDDSSPGGSYYPMSKWRPGDQFLDEHELDVSETLQSDKLWGGMYFYQTGERLAVLTASVPTQANRIAIGMQSCE